MVELLKGIVERMRTDSGSPVWGVQLGNLMIQVEWLKYELAKRHRPSTEVLIDQAFPDLNTNNSENKKEVD